METQDTTHPSKGSLTLADCQRLMRDTYFEKDSKRGVDATFMYFVSEVGELAEALRENDNLEKEFADCLAWLVSVANLKGIDLDNVMKKHYLKCPNCGEMPCCCVSKP